MDSFGAAAQCAQEALDDPGNLRFTHVPSLVRFVSSLSPGSVPADWSPAGLAHGLRLNRLLWELGLRGEAERLFQVLLDHFLGCTASSADTVAIGNALAAVGASLGRPDDVRRALWRVSLTARLGEVDAPARAALWANLATVELSQGYRTEAALALARARETLAAADPADGDAVRQLVAAVALRLGPREEARDALARLAESTGTVVRGRGRNDARAFLAVADLAVARIGAALTAPDPDALETAVRVLEVAGQRLSALLGAGHPDALGVQADLAAAHVEAARTARSSARLERAVGELAAVSDRLTARLGPRHPRSVTALANLVTARVEAVRAQEEPGKAERTADVLAEEAARAGRLLGADHPVARLARASSLTCRRIAAEEEPLGGGTTMLLTLTGTPRDWTTEGADYRSYAEAVSSLEPDDSAPDDDPLPQQQQWLLQGATADGTVLSALDALLRDHAVGDVVEGLVTRVLPDGVTVQLDDGHEGFVPNEDMAPGREFVRWVVPLVGEPVDVMVLGIEDGNNRPVFSRRRALTARTWTRLERAKERGAMVAGIVDEVTSAGVVLGVDSVRAFLPASHLDMPLENVRSDHLGRNLQALVIELDRDLDFAVLSRRAWDPAQRSRPARELLGALKEGQVRPGTVTSVGGVGAFVDLGGVDGLVPPFELPTGPAGALREGDVVQVEIVEVDQRSAHVSLSLKRPLKTAWRRFAQRVRAGELAIGVVTDVSARGLRVRVVEHVEGLIPAAVVAEHQMRHPEVRLGPGVVVLVRIDALDVGQRVIGLSLVPPP
ncbi:S1 RNA-binding domain-containing protein [Streptomyces griseosporeus]|uniref:S1 RNA-binding domain-containing protein n=1 Tax=Streptomyces griseosporeus TaxID=1910 RepID=UPI0036A22537